RYDISYCYPVLALPYFKQDVQVLGDDVITVTGVCVYVVRYLYFVDCHSCFPLVFQFPSYTNTFDVLLSEVNGTEWRCFEWYVMLVCFLCWHRDSYSLCFEFRRWWQSKPKFFKFLFRHFR